jgi:hypothetical protein
MNRTFVKYNEDGLIGLSISGSDPTIVIPEGLEEIKDKKIKDNFQPHQYRKIGKKLVRLSEKEIDEIEKKKFQPLNVDKKDLI